MNFVPDILSSSGVVWLYNVNNSSFSILTLGIFECLASLAIATNFVPIGYILVIPSSKVMF